MSGNCCFYINPRVLLMDCRDRIPLFESMQDHLNRDACPFDDRRTAHDVWIRNNILFHTTVSIVASDQPKVNVCIVL
jgi:hypothetical protein